jgi:hypothetical protein
MRKFTALAALCLGLTFIGPDMEVHALQTVVADGPEDEGKQYCGKDQLGNGILCDAEQLEIILTTGGGGTTASSGTSSSAGSSVRYYAYDKLTTGPDGQACVMTGYAREGTTPGDLLSTDPVTRNVLDIHGLPLEYPPCPAQPQRPGQPAQVETASMIARRAWKHVPLPQPRPSIAPGRAITGKLAYLETRGQLSHVYTTMTPLGQLNIYARGAYVVTWGDGHTSGPYNAEGLPWPNGTITHEYQNVGPYDIVVTERWTATWSLAGESGVLRTLQTTGRIDDFPVEQIQAVIGR